MFLLLLLLALLLLLIAGQLWAEAVATTPLLAPWRQVAAVTGGAPVAGAARGLEQVVVGRCNGYGRVGGAARPQRPAITGSIMVVGIVIVRIITFKTKKACGLLSCK